MMMLMPPFTLTRLPVIQFGEGQLYQLPHYLKPYGKRVLMVMGARSFRTSTFWEQLQAQLREQQFSWETVTITDEPSPQLIDNIVQTYHSQAIQVVVGIGGGSVLDAAKAIAGLLPRGNSVMDHLEGVGKGIPYQGPALPFFAVPTTAGTGSEASKNAVLSHRGENGFKKSFRHELLVAQMAIVDSNLLTSCPADLIAANGMDAFTQLLESYVSCNANPITDALAWSGMNAFNDGFWMVWERQVASLSSETGERQRGGYSQLAYAALLSGITLAQAGLGSVHGLAAPLGAFFPIPHGVVCGTLVAEATDINIRALQERAPQSSSLGKYAAVGKLFSRIPAQSQTEALITLVDTLRQWTQRLNLPKLSQYGMSTAAISKVIANCRGGSMKTNPLLLTDDELRELLERRL
jgi:alcohol dehydrogenase